MNGSAQIVRGLVKTSAGYIHYRSAGDGPAMVLFHINAQSSALMIELIEALAAGGIRAIAIDYPSHGHSDHVEAQPSISDYARWALEVIDGLGVDTFIALGEATGSVVAAEIVAQAPDRAAALVLVNCPYVPPGTEYPDRVKVTDDLRPADASGFPIIRSLEFMLEVDPTHSPVQPTQTHPDAQPLGWDRAGELIVGFNRPVFLLGGVGPSDASRAHELGAQGVAGIRAFWPD